jgi:uncharacterized protein YndB with AHSA1/START domain
MVASLENGWALSVTRFINAPPEQVWRVMTERQTEWWCPKPWRTEVVEQDFRAGGRSAVIMHGPDGETSPHEGVFLEVVPGVRFVSTDAIIRDRDGAYMPAGPFMIGCWEIAAEDGGTRYTAMARHWDEDAAKRHSDMGFEDGWGVCADQLKALCEGVTL